jgi:hypothetical protein
MGRVEIPATFEACGCRAAFGRYHQGRVRRWHSSQESFVYWGVCPRSRGRADRVLLPARPPSALPRQLLLACFRPRIRSIDAAREIAVSIGAYSPWAEEPTESGALGRSREPRSGAGSQGIRTTRGKSAATWRPSGSSTSLFRTVRDRPCTVTEPPAPRGICASAVMDSAEVGMLQSLPPHLKGQSAQFSSDHALDPARHDPSRQCWLALERRPAPRRSNSLGTERGSCVPCGSPCAPQTTMHPSRRLLMPRRYSIHLRSAPSPHSSRPSV